MIVSGLLERIPWWFKIGSKIALSRLPVPYAWWNAVGLFRHGPMLDCAYARQVFDTHFNIARSSLPRSFVALELGPGDSLATAVFARAAGAAHTVLVDQGPFALWDPAKYRRFANVGTGAPAVRYESLREFLAAQNATYLTGGLGSLRTLSDGAVDWSFSNAVLEHVALDEFDQTIAELYRIQKPGAVSSHQIDYRDHVGQSLHSLRFSRARWESRLFRSSGFYTNRLRLSQVRRAFTNAGFSVISCTEDRWEALPLRRAVLHADFRSFSDEDLSVRGSLIVLQKPAR